MTEGILCTIDFSDASIKAVKWSIELAKKLHAPLTILHTYRLFKQNGEAVSTKKKIEAEALSDFATMEQELLTHSGIDYDFKTEIGFVNDRIEAHARKNKIGLLVMGKNMTAVNKETFDHLVAELKIPLVIIP